MQDSVCHFEVKHISANPRSPDVTCIRLKGQKAYVGALGDVLCDVSGGSIRGAGDSLSVF